MDASFSIVLIALYLLIPVVVVYGVYRMIRHAVRVELDERDRRRGG